MIKTEIFCSLQIEGVHFWGSCNIPEVKYLKQSHRHLFGIKAYKNVAHADRDIEFIVLKHAIQEFLHDMYWDPTLNLHNFGPRSCEMIAKLLIDNFELIKCEVNEDNENGCVLTVMPESKIEQIEEKTNFLREEFESFCKKNCSPGGDISKWYWELFQAGANAYARNVKNVKNVNIDPYPWIETIATIDEECDVCGAPNKQEGCKTC